MFYETHRMMRKQAKYEKTKAYEIIESLRSSELSDDEVLASLDILLNGDNTETFKSVLLLAKRILGGKENEGLEVDTNNSNVTHRRLPTKPSFDDADQA